MQQKSFKIRWYLRELEFPKNWHRGELLTLTKSKFSERQFFSIVTCKWIFDIPLLINLFISLIKLKNIHYKQILKEYQCTCKIDKLTHSKRSVEQHITLPKISLQCILKNICFEEHLRTTASVHFTKTI